MVTKKKLIIPIFDYGLTILIYDRWSEVKDIFNTETEPRAITKSLGSSAIVAINANKPDVIIHESEHIKNLIWDYIGYTPQRDNDEVDAYLITYIYRKIKDVYNKHERN
jgi:hypothetical protein